MLKTFLLLALLGIRFQTAPGHFAVCGDDVRVAYHGTAMEVGRGELVIDTCPEYADCDRGTLRRIEIESDTLPDLRTIIAPQDRVWLRVRGCEWELAARSRETAPRLLFYAARDVLAARTAAVKVQRRARKSLHVSVENGRALRVDVGQSVRSPGWLVHNVDGSAYWIAAADR